MVGTVVPLPLQTNPLQLYRLRADEIESSFAEENWGVLKQNSAVCSYGEEGQPHIRLY